MTCQDFKINKTYRVCFYIDIMCRLYTMIVMNNICSIYEYESYRLTKKTY